MQIEASINCVFGKRKEPNAKQFQDTSQRGWTISSPAKINDNAYKLDLLGEYNISATFNISDLSHFDVGDDSRTNPFEV